jgi:hypothetical protein
VAGGEGAGRVEEERLKASRFVRNGLMGNSASLAFLGEG